MTTTSVPERIRWVVEQLDVRPGHRVVEVGGAPGAAAQLVCERLTTGRMVAVDRSARGNALMARRNQQHVDSGRLDIRTVALADLDPRDLGDEAEGSFDVAFAVNVNVFWTSPATVECDVLGRLLRPQGTLVLAYSTPGSDHDQVVDRVEPNLLAAGFRPTRRLSSPHTAAVVATPPRRRR